MKILPLVFPWLVCIGDAVMSLFFISSLFRLRTMFPTRVFFLNASAVRWMKIVVGVKQVVDHSIKVRVKDNKLQISNLKRSLNPFDEIALEEAVRLKENGIASEITAVCVGPTKSVDVLRNALAMGCDKAIHVVTKESTESLDSLAIAKIFCSLHNDLNPDLWLLGKQAIDGDFGCTPQLLAGMLNIPLSSFASKISVMERKVCVTREVDAGNQIEEIDMPCIVSVDLRLNTPRYLKLPSIMKARKKPIESRDISTFKLVCTSKLRTTEVTEPVLKRSTVKLHSVDEVIAVLRSSKILPN